MRNLLQFTTIVFMVCMCITGRAESYMLNYADHYCSPLAIGKDRPLGRLRKHILEHVVQDKFHPGFRRHHVTCTKRTEDGYTMWARAQCGEPHTMNCLKCLVGGIIYLDKNCLWFSGGRVKEDRGYCALQFADYDICAQ
ncbi:unnamed protein product [Linum tenue]|uniref:Uncharacterized protein n=1 Tax=Linum tenue TaxID=586396 RepID=A0AAV0I7K6_9ROSI|nr:unnamed protein product [Linum tenue]